MDGRVIDAQGRVQAVRRVGVAVNVVHDHCLADVTRGERCFQSNVPGIEAPHEAEHDEPLPPSDFGVHHALRVFQRRRQRFLQHRGLTGCQARKRVLGVQIIRARDHYRVDRLVFDDRLR